MLTIRLRRAGTNKRPFFRVVVSEGKSKLDGGVVESIGHYNPRTKPETVVLDRDRLAYWVSKGAQASDTVRTLVARMPAVVAAPAEQASASPELAGPAGA